MGEVESSGRGRQPWRAAGRFGWHWLGRFRTVVVLMAAAGGVLLLVERGWVSGTEWGLLAFLFLVVAVVGSIVGMARIQKENEARQERRSTAERALPPGVGFEGSRPAGLADVAESEEPPLPWAPPARDPVAIICPAGGGVVQSAAFSPVSGYLAQGLAGGDVLLWHQAGSGSPRLVFTLPTAGPAGADGMTSVAFSPDGMLLACGGAGAVWNVSEPARPRFVAWLLTAGRGAGPKWSSGVSAVAFAADARLLVARGGDWRHVGVWDVHAPAGLGYCPNLSRFSKGRRLRHGQRVAGSPSPVAPTQLAVSTAPDVGVGGRAQSASVLVAAAVILRSRGERVRLWTLTPARRPQRPTAIDPNSSGTGISMADSTPAVHGVALSPNGRLLAVASEAKTGSVASLAIPTGDWWSQAEVGLWDVTHRDRAQRCAWLRGRGASRHVSAVTERRQQIRDERTLTGHAGVARAVAFSPEGRRLATGGDDGTGLVWDVSDPYRLRLLEAVRHGSAVHAVTFDPTGTRLATTSTTETRVWSLTAGSPPRTSSGQ